jgi:hypothetical protein
VTIRRQAKRGRFRPKGRRRPQGTSTVSGDAPSCSPISTPTLPCPFDHIDIVERGDEHRALLGGKAGADLLAALGGAIIGDDAGAGGKRGVALHRRSVSGHDDGRRDAEPAGGDGHSLGMVAGGECDHPAPPSSALSWSRRFIAPLSLKLPPCCRHSALIQTGRRPQSSGSSGVRVT